MLPIAIHQHSLMQLQVCFQLYACLFLLTVFGGISFVVVALMTLYNMGGVQMILAVCVASSVGLLRFLVSCAWADAPPERLSRCLAIDTYTLSSQDISITSSCCPICLHNMTKGEMVSKGETCGHVFHHACLATWVKKRATCPCCRHDLERWTKEVKSPVHKSGVFGIFDGVFDSMYS